MVLSIDEVLESVDVVVDESVDVETGSVEVVELVGDGVTYTTVVVYVIMAVYVVVYGVMIEVVMSVVVSVKVVVSVTTDCALQQRRPSMAHKSMYPNMAARCGSIDCYHLKMYRRVVCCVDWVYRPPYILLSQWVCYSLSSLLR